LTLTGPESEIVVEFEENRLYIVIAKREKEVSAGGYKD
jgi:hypothetical protein